MLIDLVTPLCVLAVAFLGFAMLSGRLEVRRGFRVVFGCFVLLGAPILAASVFSLIDSSNQDVALAVLPSEPRITPRENLPPADNDPYAGASLRVD